MTREEAIKILMGYSYTPEERTALGTLLPEFRMSEDERIRRKMIEHFKAKTKETWCNMPVKDIIAYLEKQKEQKVDIDKLRRDIYQSGYNDGYQHGKEDAQKEQKPNIELIQRSWYMEGYNDRKFGNEPKWIIKTGEGGPKHELNPRYGQPLTERQVTEEQLHNLNEAIKSFRMDGFDRIADSLHSLYNILTTQAQKSAEWSEEDKEKIVTISEIIEHCTTIPYSGGTLTLNKEYKKELLCFLKSLRPQYHGDVTMTEAYKMGLEAGKLSSWKPSEHQMNILKAVKEYVGRGSGYWGEGLGSLIEDLEKL